MSVSISNFKNYQITEKASETLRGGAILRKFVTSSNRNFGWWKGLPINAMYFYNTNNGKIYDINGAIVN